MPQASPNIESNVSFIPVDVWQYCATIFKSDLQLNSTSVLCQVKTLHKAFHLLADSIWNNLRFRCHSLSLSEQQFGYTRLVYVVVITLKRIAFCWGSWFHFQVCSLNHTELWKSSILLKYYTTDLRLCLLFGNLQCFCAKYFFLFSPSPFQLLCGKWAVESFFLGFCYIRDYFFSLLYSILNQEKKLNLKDNDGEGKWL